MTKRRIALFGGSFDPVHYGHTRVARAAAQQLEAEMVVFIPAKCSPLKRFLPHASDEDRSKMIELAIQEDDVFSVSACELKRPAPSYTLDTVQQFQTDYGAETSVYWLLGADSVGDLVYWHRVEELLDTCNLAVMVRGGYEAPAFDQYASLWGSNRIEKLRRNVIETPSIDISSTIIRERLAAGGDVSGMLAPQVVDYIRQHQLYARV